MNPASKCTLARRKKRNQWVTPAGNEMAIMSNWVAIKGGRFAKFAWKHKCRRWLDIGLIITFLGNVDFQHLAD